MHFMQKSVSAVVKRIRAALKERISEKEWLDSTTKQRALNKVDSIIAFLVYPEFIYNDDELNQLYATVSKGAISASCTSPVVLHVTAGCVH